MFFKQYKYSKNVKYIRFTITQNILLTKLYFNVPNWMLFTFEIMKYIKKDIILEIIVDKLSKTLNIFLLISNLIFYSKFNISIS